MGTLADKAGEVVSAGIEAAEKRSLSPTEQVMKMVTTQAGVAIILIEAIENLTSAVHVVAKQVAKLEGGSDGR